ncbi:MAG: hypothetical protein IRZ10_10375 [Thermoflavifilum sp.]|nr:hypothetical protein [Thermoflavifilum sp.]
MKEVSRIVIDADPDVRRMLEEIKATTGQTMKEILERLIRDEYRRIHGGGQQK